MAEIKTPLTKEDWSLYRLVHTPAIFSEFVRSTDEVPFKLWAKQIREINREALHKKRIQARFLGKSITVMDEFNSAVVQYDGPDGVALLGTRADLNIQPIFEKMVALYERNHFLKFFLQPGDRSVDRKNHEIRLRNNAVIKGRIQGKDGQGFNTVHPNIGAWLDEVQLLDDSAVGEFYGMINAGLPVWASGVPNGVRTSWAYRIDTDLLEGFVGGNMTRLDDPGMTPEFLESLKRAYGGETSNMYRQKVLGEWGADARMTFDLERIEHDMPVKPGERNRAPPWYRSIQIDAKEYGPEVLPSRFAFRQDMPNRKYIYIAADHGQTASPTTAYVHFFDTKEGCWRQYMRFLLYGMQAPIQAEIFHFVIVEMQRMYNCPVIVGLDTTGQGGQAVAALLEDMKHEVVWANVSEKVSFGERLETDEEMQKRLDKDPITADPARQLINVEMPLRQVAIPHVLLPNLYNGTIRVVEEDSLWKQLGSTTDHSDRLGKTRVYETDYSQDGQMGYNHDLSAFEVFAAMLHFKQLHPEALDPETDVWMYDMDVGWGDYAE
jgi:hypothetical protein